MTLTTEQILALEPGPETDALVAAQIGWRLYNPSENLTTAFQMEEWIRFQDATEAYRTALKDIVSAEDTEGLHFWWLLLHATPLQRSKAYLMLYVA